MGEHDLGYRQLFSHPEMVEDLIKGFVRCQALLDLADFSTLEKVPGHFVSDHLRERIGDCVWKIRCGHQLVYILIMLEFQTAVDYWMALRMLTYGGLLYQDLYKSKVIRAYEPLPPLLPIVIYRGQQPWNVPESFSDYYQHAERLGVGDLQLQSRYILLDVNKTECLEGNKTSALFEIERGKDHAHLGRVLDKLIHLFHTGENAALRRDFLTQVIRLGKLPAKAQPISLEEARTMLAENIEKITEGWIREGRAEGRAEGRVEGRAEGLAEGRAEGLAEGRAEGLRRVLTVQLEAKFGKVPQDILDKLTFMDEDALLALSQQLLMTDSLDALFAECAL